MNIIKHKRTVTPGAAPPATIEQGELFAVLDQLGAVDLYMGDQAGTPVLLNPAPTPVGGVTFDYIWDSAITVSDPGIGGVKLNGTQSVGGTATTLSVNYSTRNGNDFTGFWITNVNVGDVIGLFEQGGGGGAGGETVYWEVTGFVDRISWGEFTGRVAFYGGNDIDNNRDTLVFFIPAPVSGFVVLSPDPTDNLVQPTADHPALRFLRTTGQTTNTLTFSDELSNYAAGFRIIGTDAGGDLEVEADGLILDAGVF